MLCSVRSSAGPSIPRSPKNLPTYLPTHEAKLLLLLLLLLFIITYVSYTRTGN